jgi:DNA-binding CsgD family transcriptional regulator
VLRDTYDDSSVTSRISRAPTSPILEMMLTDFHCGKELAAELGVRLATEASHSLTDVYETLRKNIYRKRISDDSPLATTLNYDDPDERLTRLAVRLAAPDESCREPQALILTTKRHGVGACLRHIFTAQNVPAQVIELTQLASVLGVHNISRIFPGLRYVVVDCANASGQEVLQHAAQLKFLRVLGGRYVVVFIGDEPAALADARLRSESELTLVNTLPELMVAANLPTESPLTPRERGVLQLIAEGATNQQAASKLGISIATVKTYLERAQVKLRSIDRVSTVAVAVRRGWL